MHFPSNTENLKTTGQLLDEANKAVLFTAFRPRIIMERGRGMCLWDLDGKRYLDFMGGWAVTCLGHSPDVIKQALEQQADRLINASPAFYNRPMIELAKLLTDTSCFDRVFFATSGAEANEGAIKLARKYGAKHRNGAYEIITVANSFHGRTLATMSASGKKAWDTLYEPKVPGFIHVPINDAAAVRSAINTNTCAIMIEPLQGEGGVHEASADYLRTLRELCDQNEILLICDEIQTGLGRTGMLYAYQHYGVEPDIMTLAKGIGGGYPLAALLAKEFLNIFEPGDQGGTYSSQPLGMAVGLAVIREIIAKNLAENARLQGEYLLKGLRAISERYRLGNIRGKGLLLAFDLPCDRGKDCVAACLAAGLIVNSPQPATIRLMPPLIVEREDSDEMFAILTKVLDRILD